MPTRTRHTVRYVTASDDVRLAWADSGAGMPLVKAATWLTHLEYDLESPVWRHWAAFLSGHFRFVRYDERGCGMSDWDVRDLSLERRVLDLETIVETAGLTDPFVLLGISHGAAVCIAYAVRHPERISRMVLYGGFARGALRRGDEEARRTHRAIIDLTSLWGSDNPAFRQVFTSRFIPEGTDEQLRWFNDLCRKTTSPALAGTLLRSRADTDVTRLLEDVRTPTLVVHARDDAIAPRGEGHLLASEIPGAEFVELDSRNHVLLEHEPAWAHFQNAVLEFTGQKVPAAPDPAVGAKLLDDWPRVKLVLEGALARGGADREAYLAEACGPDPALRAQVEILLAAQDRAGTFLETPAALLLDESRGREEMSGRVVSSYRLVSQLGAGGMGEVYLAHDAKLDRPVALKFLSPELVADPDRLRRFHQEARAASSLNHPHIVVVHDFGELDGRPYMVTEFVEGETLRQRLQRGPLSPRDVVDIGIQIAGALAAAHARGLVHRDIKPDNVMVRPDGYVKVLDFGLAKLAAATGWSARIHPEPRTQPGMVMGTPRYMSPEQARGLDLDARSDIWSLGVVLYEMIAGRPPFEGATPADAIAAVLGADPPALELQAPRTLPALSAIVTKAMRKDRLERYADAGEMLADLRRLTPNLTPTQTATPAARVTGDDESGLSSAGKRRATGVREQEIRFCTTSDGVSVAYSAVGTGPYIVRVLGHFTHLEMEWEWPDLRRFWEQLAERHTVVRYDGRGIGLSDRYEGDFTEETRQRDLDAVLTAVGAEKAALLGISEGGWTAATYAVQHPERITHLILYGAYCRGALARPGYDREEDEALVTLIRKGWGRDTPTFRQVFTSQFFRSDADPGLIDHFNELQRVSADPETAARYHESCHRRGDGRDLYRQIKVPVLVIHSRDDLAVSAEEGRLLASIIPGAQLVLLPSGMHYFPTDSEVVTKAAGAIARFLSEGRS